PHGQRPPQCRRTHPVPTAAHGRDDSPAISAVCNNARVNRDGERPIARQRQVRLAGLLALLLAVSMLTATATTITPSTRTDAGGTRTPPAAAAFTLVAGHDATVS